MAVPVRAYLSIGEVLSKLRSEVLRYHYLKDSIPRVRRV
jgi:hypothetical protein